MFSMENCFYVLISQAVRCLKDPSVLPRDKQRLKQELSSELVSHTVYYTHIRKAILFFWTMCMESHFQLLFFRARCCRHYTVFSDEVHPPLPPAGCFHHHKPNHQRQDPKARRRDRSRLFSWSKPSSDTFNVRPDVRLNAQMSAQYLKRRISESLCKGIFTFDIRFWVNETLRSSGAKVPTSGLFYLKTVHFLIKIILMRTVVTLV